MAREKANEPLRWKDRLDQPAYLPGESLADTEASWNRLHERLKQKPAARRAAVYWAAAACLLVVSAIGWIMLVQNSRPLVKNKIQQTPAGAATRLLPAATGIPDTVAAAHRTITKEYVIRASVKTGLLHPAFSHTTLAGKPVAYRIDSVQEPAPVITVNTIQPTDTINLTAAMPARKKLRVVHINTLGVTGDQSQLAGNSSASYPQTTLLHQDDLSRFSVSKNTSDNILKIKLSSN